MDDNNNNINFPIGWSLNQFGANISGNTRAQTNKQANKQHSIIFDRIMLHCCQWYSFFELWLAFLTGRRPPSGLPGHAHLRKPHCNSYHYKRNERYCDKCIVSNQFEAPTKPKLFCFWSQVCNLQPESCIKFAP